MKKIKIWKLICIKVNKIFYILNSKYIYKDDRNNEDYKKYENELQKKYNLNSIFSNNQSSLLSSCKDSTTINKISLDVIEQNNNKNNNYINNNININNINNNDYNININNHINSNNTFKNNHIYNNNKNIKDYIGKMNTFNNTSLKEFQFAKIQEEIENNEYCEKIVRKYK